jgi:hypothetical protein
LDQPKGPHLDHAICKGYLDRLAILDWTDEVTPHYARIRTGGIGDGNGEGRRIGFSGCLGERRRAVDFHLMWRPQLTDAAGELVREAAVKKAAAELAAAEGKSLNQFIAAAIAERCGREAVGVLIRRQGRVRAPPLSMTVLNY